MKKECYLGLILAIAATTLVSCTQGSVMDESSPQVTNHTISLSFFEQSMGDLGSRSRANDTRTLQACHTFSELEVALFPVGKESEAAYIIQQDSLEEDFGKVSLQIPAGEYHLVAVAAATKMPFDKRIDIKSCSEVRFPNDRATDMVYVYKDIKVENSMSQQSFNSAMTRGVSCFILQATELTPEYVASEEIEISGGCGNVFNPSTGTCKEEETVSRTITVDANRYKLNKLHFSVYVFLKSPDVDKMVVKAVTKNKSGKIVRSCYFDDVHMITGKSTTYTGMLFSSNDKIAFSATYSPMEDSGYSKDF